MSCLITNSIWSYSELHEIQNLNYDKPEFTNAGKLARRVSSLGLEITIAGSNKPIPKQCDKYINNSVRF